MDVTGSVGDRSSPRQHTAADVELAPAEGFAEAALALALATTAEEVRHLVVGGARTVVGAAVAELIRAPGDPHVVAGAKMASVIAAPLGDGELLRAGAELPAAFSGMHQRLLSRLADLGVASLQRIRHYGVGFSREQQRTALAGLRSDVAATLSSSKPLNELIQQCCQAAVTNLNAAFARIWILNAEENVLELRGSAGMYTHLDGGHARVPVGKFKIGLIAEEKRAHLTNDVQHDERVGDRAWAAREKMVAFAGYPLVADGELLGVFAMFSKESLAEETLQLLGSVADVLAQGLKRKRAELALEDRARDLQRSNGDLEQFAYVASHDLQEPLRMVAGYLQLIERRYKDKLDESGSEFIGFAVEGAQRMQRLINDLLSYSRVGRRGFEFSEVDTSELLARVLQTLEPTIVELGAVIELGDLPRVWADPTQLEQLLQNLIANALKFHGTEQPRITIGAKRDGREWRFTVSDNGIGIEQQYFERIFVIFQRLHGRHEYPGTGIGLAICKKIVERHGGHIGVESQPGAGASFFFTLAARGGNR